MIALRPGWPHLDHLFADRVIAALPDSDFAGLDGFVPNSRGSFMLDVVFVAMFFVLITMLWSIWLVKYRRRYVLHKWLQVALGAILLVAIVAFEVDMRLSGWQHRAAPSPYYGTDESIGLLFYALFIHLFFAVPTAVLWVYVIAHALVAFDSPPKPGAHSARHLFWGKVAAWEMLFTALTGWAFYWLAFVA